VIRKAPWLLIPLAVGLVIAAQRQDIARYLKIKQMSAGGSHPENVPAGGSQSYPQPGGARTTAPETSILPAGEAQRARRPGCRKADSELGDAEPELDGLRQDLVQ
jgi:hypothetical protein